MKKILLSGLITSLIFFAGTGTAAAQDDGMLVIPVELFACSYNDGKGPADLESWTAKWNAWADENKITDYAAWTLTPYYYGQGPNEGIDVIWMGAGKDAVALGKAQDTWLATNNGLANEVGEIMSCFAHSNYASINVKAPPKGETPSDSVLTFSDCKYKAGASFSGLNSATGEWAQYLTDAGSTAGIWNWYPAYGGGGEEYDFKWLQSYKNLAELGADYERYGNGRGFQTRGKLMGHMIDCDSSRAYLAKSRRFVQLR